MVVLFNIALIYNAARETSHVDKIHSWSTFGYLIQDAVLMNIHELFLTAGLDFIYISVPQYRHLDLTVWQLYIYTPDICYNKLSS